MPYNIRMVSTYPPRKCGIGTFSRDLADALEHFTGEVNNIRVTAIDNEALPYNIPVDLVIDQYNPESWDYAIKDIFARASESTNPAIVILQREYGLDPDSQGNNGQGTSFVDMSGEIFLFFVIIVLAAFLTGFFALLLARIISRPVLDIVRATRRFSGGEIGYEIRKKTGMIELDTLAKAFSKMSTRLRQRDDSLKALNGEFAALSKTYLDLVGFISRELKGIAFHFQ